MAELPQVVEQMRAEQRCLEDAHWFGSPAAGQLTPCQCGEKSMTVRASIDYASSDPAHVVLGVDRGDG